MNGSLALLESYRGVCEQHAPHCELWVFPPAVYIAESVRTLAPFASVGIQSVSEALQGAYTGEISAAMVSAVGATHCLVGHSERRQLFGEDDVAVGRKLKQCVSQDLCAVLCVGETLAQREAEQTLDVLQRQLDVLAECEPAKLLVRLAIAYEPVWAIGSGLSATPDEAQQVHAWMRELLLTRFGQAGGGIPLLYGGSVKPANAEALLAQADIDGALVGGASLEVAQFAEILRCTR